MRSSHDNLQPLSFRSGLPCKRQVKLTQTLLRVCLTLVNCSLSLATSQAHFVFFVSLLHFAQT